MFEKILVAIDGSPASEKALAAAADLALHYQAELLAIGVAEVPEVVGMMDETRAKVVMPGEVSARWRSGPE
jgi:nucleotide-binding universal stress UspA family protein